jgi:hypothetical protein
MSPDDSALSRQGAMGHTALFRDVADRHGDCVRCWLGFEEDRAALRKRHRAPRPERLPRAYSWPATVLVHELDARIL